MSLLTSIRAHRYLAPGLLVGIVLLALLAGCGSSSTPTTTSAPTATVPAVPTATIAPTAPPTTPPAPPTAVSGSQVAIAIQSFAFNPQTITIKTGTTVTWTDKDNVAHTVTSTSGPGSFNSGPLTASGGTFHFTFTQAGTYQYHCMIHPFMMATITVVS
jgi:plastocyanin